MNLFAPAVNPATCTKYAEEPPIGGEDRQSSLRGGQVDQGVVEAFLALVFLKIPDACIPVITPASMQVRSSGVNRRPTGTASKRTA